MIPSPRLITHLKINEIFVFGSNLEGRHKRGAAKQALQWGAIYGRGIGPAGKTYAIPTRKFVKGNISTIGTKYYKSGYSLVTMPLSEINQYIEKFINFVTLYKDIDFLVTEIGCANTGYTPIDMAKLFRLVKINNITNIHLPESFIKILN